MLLLFLRVEREVVQVVLHVDGVNLPEVDQLLQRLVDEDDADESGEGFLGEARDVADQRAGVGGDQQQAEEGRPEADTGPQGQVGQAVVTEDDSKTRYFKTDY